MNPIPDSQVLERLKESPIWKATEDAVLAERAESRRQLLDERKALLAARPREAARLHRAEREAWAAVEAAQRALAAAQAEHERHRHAESVAGTTWDGLLSRLEAALRNSAEEVTRRFGARLRALEEVLERRTWVQRIENDVRTSYLPAAVDCAAEVAEARARLVEIRARAAAVPVSCAELSAVERELEALLEEAKGVLAKVPAGPGEDWIGKAWNRVRKARGWA